MALTITQYDETWKIRIEERLLARNKKEYKTLTEILYEMGIPYKTYLGVDKETCLIEITTITTKKEVEDVYQLTNKLIDLKNKYRPRKRGKEDG